MILKLTSLTFENPNTGEKIESKLSEGFELKLKKPFSDDSASADFLAGAIIAGAYDSTKPFHPESEWNKKVLVSKHLLTFFI